MFTIIDVFVVPGVDGTVFISRGVACDHMSSKDDEVTCEKAVIQRGVTSKLYNAIDKKNKISSMYFPSKDMALGGLITKSNRILRDSDIVINEVTIDDVTYTENNKYFAVDMQKSKLGGYCAEINRYPNTYGYNDPKLLVYFPDKTWVDVSEGPAMVKIVAQDTDDCGFTLGKMVRFDSVSISEARDFISNNDREAKESVDDKFIVVYEVDSPVRGRYIAITNRSKTFASFIDKKEDGELFFNRMYCDIILSDVKSSRVRGNTSIR